MFTGIIRAVGRVAAVTEHGGDRRLRITAEALPWNEFARGESIAINGVCLTADALQDDGFETDVSPETLAVTTLGDLRQGSRVNLEPALALGERLGGHLVSGHVDGTARVRRRESEARAVRFEFELPAALRRYVARKGSICIDGVSLTVNDVSAAAFDVMIIPHTLDATVIDEYRVGTIVNLEVDMLARYLERLLAGDEGTGLTRDFLEEHGYA